MLKPCLNLTPAFTWLARTRVSSKVHPPFMDSSRLLALEAAKCRSGPCPSAWPSVFATVRVLSIALGAKLFSEIWLLSTITSSQTDPSRITHDTTTSTGTLDLTTRRDRTLNLTWRNAKTKQWDTERRERTLRHERTGADVPFFGNLVPGSVL